VEAAVGNVSNAACNVIAVKDKNGRNALHAYIALREINKSKLITALSSLLPDYMIPQEFIPVDEFPLNLNGKIDKNKLIHLHK
jgi:acyl-CoA synthetase (AMP-forming)/AMP-acid ligase II